MVTSVSIDLYITDATVGSHGLFAMNAPWQESSATGETVNWRQDGGQVLLARVEPRELDAGYTITLNELGVALIQSWIDGTVPNNGLIIRAIEGSGDDMGFRSSEYRNSSRRPRLRITTQQ
jgi:hypothetical protein